MQDDTKMNRGRYSCGCVRILRRSQAHCLAPHPVSQQLGRDWNKSSAIPSLWAACCLPSPEGPNLIVPGLAELCQPFRNSKGQNQLLSKCA